MVSRHGLVQFPRRIAQYDAMPLIPGSDLGPYRIVEKIGQGGMASVYKAYHAALSRFVALKILPPQMAADPQFQVRFKEEAVAVANLRHPNIMAVHDYGEIEGVTFIVNEYVDGGTFDLQMGSPLPLSYVIDILGPIAGALDYAHSRGVIHRDVKPSNILVAKDGKPLLGDFGLARMMMPDRDVTSAGMILGTPNYMAPEQGQGDPRPESDTYSLGIIAYQALTGRVPFQAATPMAIIIAHQTEPLPMPRSVNPDIAPEVEEALIKCLARAPEDRYQSAEKFIRALRSAREESPGGGASGPPGDTTRAAGAAGSVSPPSVIVGPPAARGMSRNTLLVIAGIAVLLVLLACGGGGAMLLAARGKAKPTPGTSPAPSGNTAQSPAPAGGDKGMSVDAAVAAAGAKGYSVCDTSEYMPAYTLHVLICNKPGEKGERVFFFTDAAAGTDTDDDSAHLDFGVRDENSAAFDYTLFKASDPECCPTGGKTTVHFKWDGSSVTPLDDIPPSDRSVDGSRR
jgi:tRNA A-37 threonylcarbamoyl transferase component Bud32